MQKLADLQAAFAAALVDPGLPAPQGLRRQVRLPQSRRFDVYRNNMMVSLIKALESAFPAVRRLVGSDFEGLHPPGAAEVSGAAALW